MSNTEKAYKEAGMLPPVHAGRVSPELHVVHPELQAIPVAAPAEIPVVEQRATSRRAKRGSTGKRTSRTAGTTSSTAPAPASTDTSKEA